mmetsp:Transcript_7615/g.31731  ORF Transcript_7615/g.31731 Transcript_7615/m.31731 type:complete len:277 (+) Transcript_7615:1464-2294(+)
MTCNPTEIRKSNRLGSSLTRKFSRRRYPFKVHSSPPSASSISSSAAASSSPASSSPSPSSAASSSPSSSSSSSSFSASSLASTSVSIAAAAAVAKSGTASASALAAFAASSSGGGIAANFSACHRWNFSAFFSARDATAALPSAPRPRFAPAPVPARRKNTSSVSSTYETLLLEHEILHSSELCTLTEPMFFVSSPFSSTNPATIFERGRYTSGRSPRSCHGAVFSSSSSAAVCKKPSRYSWNCASIVPAGRSDLSSPDSTSCSARPAPLSTPPIR